MAMSKAKLLGVICDLVGGPNVARVVDARDGWPGIVDIKVTGGRRRFSMHVGLAHSMSRKPNEYRFQNPVDGTPVQIIDRHPALLIGAWLMEEGPPILIAADPEIRLGDNKRLSFLFHLPQVAQAQVTGWVGPHLNKKNQVLYFFYPSLLPTYTELMLAEVAVDQTAVQYAIDGSGLALEPKNLEAADRVRQSSTRLVRDARFSREVITAYDGRCAMCGLNLQLVSGAHIFPVAATETVQFDQVWNGICLCDNHHRAFDSHRIHIDPKSFDITLDNRLRELANKLDYSRSFVASTFTRLQVPDETAKRPRKDMFESRYEFYAGRYDWVKKSRGT